MDYFNVFVILSFVFLNHVWLQNVSGKEGKLWFVCVAGYDFYKYTYGFEAGVYRICEKFGGADSENIITISPDNAAYHRNNPIPGLMMHGKEEIDFSSNVYSSVNATYNSRDMTKNLFYEILRGNRAAVKGIGHEKVLQSGPQDTIVLIFINIGDFGVMSLTNNEYLYAEEFIPFVEDLYEKQKFKKMLIFVDGHQAGSMFDNYLGMDTGIIAWTNSARQDSLDLCHYNYDVSAFTSTCYTYILLEYLEELIKKKEYGKIKLQDFYQSVRTKTSFLSGVSNLYGNLELGELKLAEFFGPVKSEKTEINSENSHHEAESLRSNPVAKILNFDQNLIK